MTTFFNQREHNFTHPPCTYIHPFAFCVQYYCNGCKSYKCPNYYNSGIDCENKTLYVKCTKCNELCSQLFTHGIDCNGKFINELICC